MINQGFPSTARLLTAEDYSRVFEGASKRKSSVFMKIFAVPGNASSIGRVGIIVPKRFIPSAVQRNRIKRVVREWFRCHGALCAGWDYVVTFKPQSKTLTKKALSEQLNILWRQIIES